MYEVNELNPSALNLVTQDEVDSLKDIIGDSMLRDKVLIQDYFRGSETNHPNIVNLTEMRLPAPTGYKPIGTDYEGIDIQQEDGSIKMYPGYPIYQIDLTRVVYIGVSMRSQTCDLSFINGVPGYKYNIMVDNRGEHNLRLAGVNVPNTVEISTDKGSEFFSAFTLYSILCILPNMFVLESVVPIDQRTLGNR